ncbi:MAG TPA: MBL fold metallo-hydrolase [Methylomirabilota bacterium]|nr:MBL fold metallo-hydrolase [Methylomirabilota bacterium]
MRRIGILLAVVLTVMSCATTQQRGQALVSRGIEAVGGADALARVRTLSVRGTVRQWEPEQSHVPSGETRFAGESTFTALTDVSGRATRIDWVRNFAYPAPRTFTFTEIVTADAGYVAGIDSNGRTKQSQESNPPAHSMSGLRLAAAQRELQRGSLLLLLDMQRSPDRVAVVDDVTVKGIAYPAVDFRIGSQTLTVMFDRVTGLPARIRTLDYDNIQGDSTYDLVLSDWQVMDGLRVPTIQRYELNGALVQETRIAEVKVNPAAAADRFAIPDAYRAAAAKPATGDVPYQWVLRRQFIGVYLDSDSPSWDTRASTGLRLQQLAPGVQHVVGGTHHSLMVEMKDYVVVFDAPISDRQSNWVLSTARAKYLRKPVKYLILTHHHMDHAGGIRAYAAEGATIVVGRGAAAHYRKILAAPYTRNPDLPVTDLSKTAIVEVADSYVLRDGTREVHAYLIANPHADSTLIGYVPDAKLGFVTDLWSPGTPLGAQLNPGQAAVVAGVKKYGITPQRFAGGHGSTADYSTLSSLEGK